MKLRDFRKNMKKDVFSRAEARLVCVRDNPSVLNLQLHQWVKSGDLVRLKRGLYMFSDAEINVKEIARGLDYPCYFSLEYVLNMCGIMPDAVFNYTLVTSKATRHFITPVGTFIFQKIKREAFTGFDCDTLIAEKEKALVDYFYLHLNELEANDYFWEHSRLEAIATNLNFKKTLYYAKLFDSKKLDKLLNSFHSYAKSHQNY